MNAATQGKCLGNATQCQYAAPASLSTTSTGTPAQIGGNGKNDGEFVLPLISPPVDVGGPFDPRHREGKSVAGKRIYWYIMVCTRCIQL